MKFRLISLVILVIVGLSLAIYTQCNRIKSLEKKVSIVTNNLKSEQRKTTFWTDSYKRQHAEVIEQIRTNSDLKRGTDSLSIKIRSLAGENSILLKRVSAYGNIQTEIKHDTIVKYTSIFGCHDLSNPNIKNEVCINKDSTISSSISIDPKYDLIWYDKRETINPPFKFFLWRWFQKKQTLVSVQVISNNPLVKIKSVEFTRIIK